MDAWESVKERLSKEGGGMEGREEGRTKVQKEGRKEGQSRIFRSVYLSPLHPCSPIILVFRSSVRPFVVLCCSLYFRLLLVISVPFHLASSCSGLYPQFILSLSPSSSFSSLPLTLLLSPYRNYFPILVWVSYFMF